MRLPLLLGAAAIGLAPTLSAQSLQAPSSADGSSARASLQVTAASVAAVAAAPVTLFSESFEGDDSQYTLSNTFNDGGNDHFGVTDGSDITNVTGPYSNVDGSSFLAMEDTDDNGGDGLDQKAITFDPIDATGFDTITISLLAGAGNESEAGASVYDANDFAIFGYTFDGGATQQPCVAFRYVRNGDDFNEPLAQDTDFDGVGDGAVLGTAMQTFSCTIDASGVADRSQLTVRGEFSFDSASEEFAFDLLEVSGDDGSTGEEQAVLLGFTPTSGSATEGGNGTIPVQVTTGDGQPLAAAVPFTVTQTNTGDANASDNADYSSASAGGQTFDGNLPASFFIPAGIPSGFVFQLPIPLVDGDGVEGTEIAVVQLTSSDPNVSLVEDEFSLTIFDSDVPSDVPLTGTLGAGSCSDPSFDGGRCEFDLQLTNELEERVQLTMFGLLAGPDGTERVRTNQFVLQANQTRSGSFPLNVFDGPGAYTLTIIVQQGALTDPVAGDRLELTATFTIGGAGLRALPAEAGLGSPAPNPSTAGSTVELALPAPERVEVTVYDALGRRVAVAFAGEAAAGYTPVRVDVSELPSGMYVVRAVGESFAQTQRITVVR